MASESPARIQKYFPDINPVVGVNHGMRASGFPADLMTIDCLATNKRIIVLLHDDSPETVRYQFSFRDRDPEDEFAEITIDQISAQCLYDWMKDYFSDQKTKH